MHVYLLYYKNYYTRCIDNLHNKWNDFSGCKYCYVNFESAINFKAL